MDYIEVNFTVSPKEPATEILIAELGELEFEMFQETNNGVLAYIKNEFFSKEMLLDLHVMNSNIAQVTFEYKLIEDQNWNSEWEKNFDPILVNDSCIVRAPFHQLDKDFEYDLIIEPKMSFGTGHHETTFLMLQQILKLDLSNKKVLDMGCGTAVLAILAAKRNASSILAVDIDQWAVDNSIENAQKNQIQNIKIVQGDAALLEKEQHYDVVFANINRNILLNDMASYEKLMNRGACLLMSGFYTQDIELLLDKASELNLKLSEQATKNNWAMLCLIKQ